MAQMLVEPLAPETLKERADQYAAVAQPRSRVSDGSLGYVLATRTTIHVRTVTGAEETLVLVGRASELKVHDPVLTLDGSLRVDLEILKFVAEGVSRTLFGSEQPVTIKAGRGVDARMRSVRGSFSVPAGQTFGTIPVVSTQEIHLEVDTPIGHLHTREPAVMTASITSVPPVGSAYRQHGLVPLYNDDGQKVGVMAECFTEIEEVIVPGAN
jgi:hypothetical protein